jgi:cytochrome c556
MSMKSLISLALAAALSVAVANAAAPAAPPSPEDVAKGQIETRQGLFKVIGATWGPVGGMMRGTSEFNAAAVAKAATRLSQLAPIIPDLFVGDTRKFTQFKSTSLDGIWNSQADFKAKADDLAKAATELATVAATGDKANTLKAAGAIGKACGACHDSYRAK